MVRFTIQVNLPDIDIFFTIIGSLYCKYFASTHFHLYLLKTRASESKYTVRRVYLIESHSRKKIPGRHLSTIFITDNAIRLVCIEVAHNETNFFSRFPLLTGIGVEIGNVMTRLIAVCILSSEIGKAAAGL